MHSKFLKRIAQQVVVRKQTEGSDAAEEYADRVGAGLSTEEWTDLIECIQSIKKEYEDDEGT